MCKIFDMARLNQLRKRIQNQIQALMNTAFMQFIQMIWKTVIVPIITVFRKFLKDFCTNSNIHGLRYFTIQTLHWSERFWWIISFGFVFLLCSLMIRGIWIDWNENPMTFNRDKTVHVMKIPFPTITICPRIKVLKHKLDLSSKFRNQDQEQFAYELAVNLSDTEKSQLSALRLFCPGLHLYLPEEHNDHFVNETIYDIIEDSAPNLDYVMRECRWQQQRVNCFDYLSPVMTDRGLCFKFNALNSYDIYTDEMTPGMINIEKSPNVSGWSLETGYTQKAEHRKYPITADAGQKNGLELILSLFEHDYDLLCSQTQGILITLSVPGETKIGFQNFANIELSENHRLIIEPKYSDISEGLRRYKPEQRKCFFNSERQLRFYKTYTKGNCVEECFANVTKELCGCVPFSMPRDNQTKICGAAKIKCYKNAVYTVNSIRGFSFREECNCIDSCINIEYNLKVEKNHLYMEESRRSQTNNTSQRQAQLSIFFKDSSVEVVERMETYTFTEFLAICGGLLGLFMGISLLSLVEIIYFATLRLFWIIRRPRTENIETPPDIPPPENQDDENRAVC